jgi:hypothetical protein
MGSPKKLRADGFGPDVDSQEPSTFNEFGPQKVEKAARPGVVDIPSDQINAVMAEDSERSREAFLRFLAEKGTSAVRSISGGASFGGAPKVVATLEAMKNKALGRSDWDEQYYKDSSGIEKEYQAAAKDLPGLDVAAAMTIPVGKLGGLAKGLGATGKLARVGLGAVEGAAQTGALTALNRTANDNAAPAGLEYGVSAGIGATLGGLTAGGGLVADSLAKRYAAAKAAQLAQSTAAVEKAIESQRGTYRSAVQSGSRALENVGRAAEGQAVGDDVAYAAMEALETPQARKLGEQVATNTMEQIPQRISTIEAEKAMLAQMEADKSTAIAKHAAEAGSNVFSKEALPRAKRQFFRELPVFLGGGAGALMGDDAEERTWFGLAGAGIGKVAAMGQPGTAWANMMRKPSAQAWMAQTAQKPFQAAQSALQVANPMPLAAASAGDAFSEYLTGQKKAERGDEQKAQKNYGRNR